MFLELLQEVPDQTVRWNSLRKRISFLNGILIPYCLDCGIKLVMNIVFAIWIASTVWDVEDVLQKWEMYSIQNIIYNIGCMQIRRGNVFDKTISRIWEGYDRICKFHVSVEWAICCFIKLNIICRLFSN